jgi:Cu(I)/Ag(I) efflux system membrane fusion protein
VGVATASAGYYCPMHPTFVSDKAGDCSICGMKLAVRASSTATTSREDESIARSGDEAVSEAADRTVAGRATISVSPDSRRMLGIRREAVKQMRLARQIRSMGRVTFDERRLRHVYAKCDGFVEHVYADLVGKRVRKGQPLLSLGCAGRADALDLRAPTSGSIVQKRADEGMRVNRGDLLYGIADLSHLWVMADVYETDLPLIRVSMEAALTVLSLPGKSWRGSVADVSPIVDGKTGTVTIRIEVDDRGGGLRPNMLADVFLKRDLGLGLMVPETAVIYAGSRRLVFVDHDDGRLEPRELRLGPTVGSGFQVLSGLSEGEWVVTSANFLIDSEASLKGTLSSAASRSALVSGPGR